MHIFGIPNNPYLAQKVKSLFSLWILPVHTIAILTGMDLTVLQSFKKTIEILIDRAFALPVDTPDRLKWLLPQLIAKYEKLMGMMDKPEGFSVYNRNNQYENVEKNCKTLMSFNGMITSLSYPVEYEPKIIKFLLLIKEYPLTAPKESKYLYDPFKFLNG